MRKRFRPCVSQLEDRLPLDGAADATSHEVGTGTIGVPPNWLYPTKPDPDPQTAPGAYTDLSSWWRPAPYPIFATPPDEAGVADGPATPAPLAPVYVGP
jgi:hypothetical protein